MFCTVNLMKNTPLSTTPVRNPFAPPTCHTVLNNPPGIDDVYLELEDLLSACGRFGAGWGGCTRFGLPMLHGSVKSGCFLPVQLICNIMSFLDLPALLQLREVCRFFNEVFFLQCIQQLSTSSLTRVFDETYPAALVLTNVIQERMAVLARYEIEWSHWMTRYVEMRAWSDINVHEPRFLLSEGEALCRELQSVCNELRPLMRLWLCDLAHTRRVRHNIRRQLFNLSSLGGLVSIGARPLLLPDGTLCINSPSDVISFYGRCSATSGKKGVVWKLFAVGDAGACVCYMYYDIHTDIMHIARCGGDVVKWRLHTPTTADVRCLRPPTKSAPRRLAYVESFHRYKVALTGAASFVPTSMDSILLTKYTWSEAEVLAITRAHASVHCNDDNNNNKKKNTESGAVIIIVDDDKDISATVLANIGTNNVRLTLKDTRELFLLQDELHNLDYNGSDRTSQANRGGGPSEALHSENEPNATNAAGASEEVRVEADVEMSPLPDQSVCEVNSSNSSSTSSGGICRTTTVPILQTAERVIERFVFAVYNERTSLMCASTASGEITHSVTNALFNTTIGVGRPGVVKSVRFLAAPVFKPCDSSEGSSVEEGNVLTLSLRSSNIVISRQTLIREMRVLKRCVWDDRCIQDSCYNRKGKNKINCNSCSHSAEKLKYRTWYILQGYSYKSLLMEIKSIVDISLPLITTVVTPRPWLPQHAGALVMCKERDGSGIKEQGRKLPHLSSWWCPLRDGHPYFRTPFILFLSEHMPHITFWNPRGALTKDESSPTESPAFKTLSIFDSIEWPFLSCRTMVLSPTHAFFVLAVVGEALMLVSPSCACEARCRPEGIRSAPQANKQTSSPGTAPCGPQSSHVVETSVSGSTPPSSGGWRDTMGSENEPGNGHASGTGQRAPQRQRRNPLGRLYRSTPFNEGARREQERRERTNAMRLLSPGSLFGDGFLEDAYIRTLQRGSESVLDSLRVGVLNNHPQFHCVWIRPPQSDSTQSSATTSWSLHLDEWKLTSLSRFFEVVVYDLTLRRNSSGDGFVFAALLTFSPYACQPFNDKRCVGLLIRKRMQYYLELETKNPSDGSEILWQNGILVICNNRTGLQYNVFDFDASFYDPSDNKNEIRRNRTNSMSDTSLPLSVTLMKKCRTLSSSTLGMPAAHNGGVGGEEELRYLYPLPNQSMWPILSVYIAHPIALGFLLVASVLLVLRIDKYLYMPFWYLLFVYLPFPLYILISDVLPYDQYFYGSYGIPFIINTVADVLMFVIFPPLFLLRWDAYDMFHPPWALVTIPLDVGILFKILSSFYTTFCLPCPVWKPCLLPQLLYLLEHLLCIAFVVLISIFFDGPSAADPQKPKFPLSLAFSPVFMLFLIILIKSARNYRRTFSSIKAVVELIAMVLVVAPVFSFITDFSGYYAEVHPDSSVALPSLLQSVFMLFIGLTIVFLYTLLVSISFFCGS